MATISDGTTTLTPLLVLTPESNAPSRNILHDVIARDYPDVTLYPAGLRTGQHVFLCADEASSVAIENIHKRTAVITYTPDGISSMGMTYVLAPDGNVARTLDPQTLRRWIVTVDFQEVHA
jgi:hypothetical protein